MVQQGTPEQYFGSEKVTEPVEAKVLAPEAIYAYPQRLQTEGVTDYTPLIIGVCFLGLALVVFGLGFIWLTKKG